MQQAMSRYAGGLRDAAGLDRCARELVRLAAQTGAGARSGVLGGDKPDDGGNGDRRLCPAPRGVARSALARRLRRSPRGLAWPPHRQQDVRDGLRHHFVAARPIGADGQLSR